MKEGSGTYRMIVDKETRIFIAFAEGLFDLEQGGAFCMEFMNTANQIPNQSEYALIVDVKDVKPSSTEVQTALVNALTLYVSDDFSFKHRFMTKLTSAIAQSQIARLTKQIPDFDRKLMFVNTREEALSRLADINKTLWRK
ncbi:MULTISPECIES: hypothetical protein [Brevibacillus]|jgi:hypothetical protein|uniref:STAS domain-containing protein n=1 Tax=Brevibacillus parabrevis TaxID=54914 RepID=A0A4Y3PHH1_BREPA|nr:MULTISPECIES: hypothetical protein [Brevibacillus]KZE55577.1 hypothetical protein AV540_05880 [Brevibacillus parabrevis]MBU8712294.1 hypothetical protein [Brevibacillus parabrevis]MDH6349364.1 hypothetical protein [Brevibacillus sp. 1238]MDR5001377.1 hypothetical protein [Brevibacillus parabrevis]MED2257366.1 hypothetical protein [Brevibacillus parabrevis]